MVMLGPFGKVAECGGHQKKVDSLDPGSFRTWTNWTEKTQLQSGHLLAGFMLSAEKIARTCVRRSADANGMSLQVQPGLAAGP